MTGFLLDTNVLSEFSRSQAPDQRVDRWLKTTPEESVFASVLTFAEIRRGIELLPEGKRRSQLEEWQDDLQISFAGRLLPVTKSIGDRWEVLSAHAQRRGTPLAITDGLIAATALEHDLTLVTRNVKDFVGLSVSILNPWEV
ncbi:MAG: type II toxin-antitoxin system VapC family toxin [Acidobacteriota bacterium]|nr:type II toxin-antitoxin system VapC family toxin [Acidobacteriota bacterium]